MPPVIALIICTIFVLFLLRLERKQSHDVSIALWVPTVWLLLVSSKPLATWFGISGPDMEVGSPLDRNFITFLIIAGLSISTIKQVRWARAIKQYPWLILLVGYMLISTLWSDMPYTSLKRWVRDALAPIIMAFVILTEKNPKWAVESILRRAIYVLIPFSYILIHYFPEYGREYGRWSGALMWIGVSSQKNGLAGLCLFAIIFLVWSLIGKSKGRDNPVVGYHTYFDIFILGLAIWLYMGPSHTLTYSATSAVALASGLTALIGLLWMKKKNILIGANTITIIMSIILVFGAIVPFSGGWMLSDIASTFNREETLTGRTDIWAYLIPYAMDSIILGNGYGGFWTDAHRAATSSHAHNGYLDIILNLGVIGLILFAIFLLSCCKKAHRVMIRDFYWGCLSIVVLFTAAVHNIAESSLTSLSGLLPAVILFLLITIPDH